MSVVVGINESHAADTLWIASLRKLERRVNVSETEGLRARWEFGRKLLQRRVGKLLPRGVLDEVATAVGVSRQELGFRMQFAERFDSEDELSNAVRKFGTWHAIAQEALSTKPPQITVTEPAAESTGPQSTELVEFVQHVQALNKLRVQIKAKRAATRLQTRSKAAFARRLRLVGSYLGAVALAIEEENIA